jgi:hypothetical protein
MQALYHSIPVTSELFIDSRVASSIIVPWTLEPLLLLQPPCFSYNFVIYGSAYFALLFFKRFRYQPPCVFRAFLTPSEGAVLV